MRFNRIIRLLPVLLILLLPLTGCEYSDTELVLKGKLDVTGVENDIHGPVIVGVANTDDLEYIMANPQDAVAIMVPVETLDYRFNIDLSETSLKAGDTVTVFAFADNNYNGGIPMPDAGDLFGMYIDESSFATTVTLNSGSTYVEFAPNRDYYEHNASISFNINKGTEAIYEGDSIFLVAVHQDGVDNEGTILDPPTFAVTNLDYVIAMLKTSYSNGNQYLLPVLPAVYYELPVGNPFSINNIYVFAIHDTNDSGQPDSGDLVGFYYGTITLSFIPINNKPITTDLDENDVNPLDKDVTFFGDTYP